MDPSTVIGAGLGAIFQMALEKMWEIIHRGINYPKTLQDYKATLDAMRPLVNQMVQHNQSIGRPKAELDPLERKILDGDELVRKHSNKSAANLFCFPSYQVQIEEEEESLRRTLSVEVQAQLFRNIMDIRRIVVSLTHQSEQTYDGLGTAVYGTPEEPDFVVRLDRLLHQLKSELLVKDGGTFLKLTGFKGSGKTTLAKKLCWHPHILEKFKENIFFATFSKAPLLTIIIEKLFAHYGEAKPEFHGNEDPGPKLRELLRKVCDNGPILLVLDDVHHGSEELVKKFEVSNSNLKILVTSRTELDLVKGVSHCLETLSHEDSMLLFRHYAKIDDTSPQNARANCMP